MNLDALKQAEERLSRAKMALDSLLGSSAQKERESAWIGLITALGTVYSKLEQGAKQNGASNAWFGRKKSERKSDPLLSYMHHARNCAEHTISHSGRYAKHAASFTGTIKPGASFGLRATPEGMKPFSTDPDMEIQAVTDDVHLITVRDRNVSYHPPSQHLGTPLTKFGASEIGRLAIEYVESMLAEARTMTE